MKYWMSKCIGWCILAVLGVFGFGYLVMLLWNWLMPELFGLNTVGYAQALGLLVLCKMLFGSFGGGKGCSTKCGDGRSWGRHKWKSKLKEKMADMSEEDREKFNKGMGWCTCGCPPGECNCGPECNCGCYGKKDSNCC